MYNRLKDKGIEFKTLGIPNLFKQQEPELIEAHDNFDLRLEKNARNLLRHLFYEAPLFNTKTSHGTLSIDILKSLLIKRDPALLQAGRKELQKIFNNIYSESKKLIASNEIEKYESYAFFLNTVLSMLPFLDPLEGEEISIPHLIGQEYKLVNYFFTRINISPQTGLLAKLMTKEYEIYAYGLTPVDEKNAPSHLLFMGTTYPAGQGALLAYLYNFYPGSIGAHHDMAQVEKWLANSHHEVHVHGQSKGGTMALALPAMLSEKTFEINTNKITQIFSFNPAPLAESTLTELENRWQVLSHPPKINIFTQEGDPVFKLDRGFLSDSNLYYVFLENKVNGYFSHVHNFFAHERVYIQKGNIEKENNAKYRQLISSIKYIMTYIIFPFYYVHVCCHFLPKKIEKTHPSLGKIINGLLLLPKVMCLLPIIPGVLVSVLMGGIIGGIKIMLPYIQQQKMISQPQEKVFNDEVKDSIQTSIPVLENKKSEEQNSANNQLFSYHTHLSWSPINYSNNHVSLEAGNKSEKNTFLLYPKR